MSQFYHKKTQTCFDLWQKFAILGKVASLLPNSNKVNAKLSKNQAFQVSYTIKNSQKLKKNNTLK